MTDDVDLTWDFLPSLSRFDDDLHSPYVRGTHVTLFAHSSEEKQQFTGWSIASSDPAVFRIDEVNALSDGGLSVRGQAVGEGSVRLRLLDPDGREVGRATADVVVPDRVELDAHGSLILQREDEAPVSEARVVENGEATYLVRYYRGNRELHGNGVLSVATAAGVIGAPRTSFLFENREWLTVVTSTPGASALEISADGVKVGTVPLQVVPETAIVDVVALTQSESGREDGDWMVVLAQAYDASGARVFGVDYTWNVNGVMQVGDGDLYRYRFKKGLFQMVEARRGSHTDAVMIQSDQGQVGSSNNIGCSASGAGGGTLVVAIAGLGLLARRRRRHR